MNKYLSEAVARQFKLNVYRDMMKLYQEGIDVSKNADFQKMFDSYYVVRRNENWRKKFFALLQEKRSSKEITYEEIIDHLFKETGWVEASFSSKLLATIDPEKPILDSQVLDNLGLEIKGATKANKVASAKTCYAEIVNRYKNYQKTDAYHDAIAMFDAHFPSYKDSLTDIKKIDFFLWAMKKHELRGIGIFEELLR